MSRWQRGWFVLDQEGFRSAEPPSTAAPSLPDPDPSAIAKAATSSSGQHRHVIVILLPLLRPRCQGTVSMAAFQLLQRGRLCGGGWTLKRDTRVGTILQEQCYVIRAKVSGAVGNDNRFTCSSILPLLVQVMTIAAAVQHCADGRHGCSTVLRPQSTQGLCILRLLAWGAPRRLLHCRHA